MQDQKDMISSNMEKVGKVKTRFLNSSYLIWIILALAIIFRLPGLASKSLYVDEGVTIYISGRPITEIVPLMIRLHEVHPPLYFWLVNIWMEGRNLLKFDNQNYLAWLRLSSVFFGILTVYFTYLLGIRLFNRRIANISAFFMALSSFHVYYCQELRMYPMLLFLMLASFYFFLRLLEKPGIIHAAGFVLVSGLALITHYYAIYIFAIEITFLGLIGILLWKRRKKDNTLESNRKNNKEKIGEKEFYKGLDEESSLDNLIKTLSEDKSVIKSRAVWIAASFIISWLFFLAWLPNFLRQTGAQDFALRSSPSSLNFFQIFSRLAYGFTLIHPKLGNFDLFIAASLLPLILILFALMKFRGVGKWFAGIYLIIPIFLSAIVTLMSSFNIFEYKYFFIIAPAFWMLVSAGIVSIKARWLQWTLTCLLIAANLYTGYNAQFDHFYYPQDWRKAAAVVVAQKKQGELVTVHPSMMATSMYYYYGGRGDFLPLDMPTNEKDKRLELLKKYKGMWLVTTPHHPYVRQNGLTRYLREKYPHRLILEINSFRPSNVIWIEYFDLTQNR